MGDFFQNDLSKIRKEVGKVIVGQSNIIEGLLRALLSDGHVLVEGVPGIAKTLLIRTLGEACGASTKRIQFTVDLLPTDITGVTIYDDKTQHYDVIKGPIFANFIIADEINRSPPKCVLGDTEILTTNGSLMNIENIFSKYKGDLALKEDEGEFYYLNEEFKLMSFDPKDKKIKPKRVKYLYRQLTNQPYYEITLKSGRNIKTSNMHPFFSIKDGRVYNIIAENLKIADCILIPRNISLENTNDTLEYKEEIMRKVKTAKEEIIRRQKFYIEVQKLKSEKINYITGVLKLNEKDKRLAKLYIKKKPNYIDLEINDNSFLILPKNYGVINKLNMPSNVDKRLMHFFALLISEGNQNNKKFYLKMTDKNLVEYFVDLLYSLFGIKTKYYIDKKKGTYKVALHSKPLMELIYALGYKGNSTAGNKDIPEFVMRANDENVLEFLKMYYEGDGGVSRDCVKVTSKSKLVANKLSYLLLRFGLISKISYEYSETSDGVGDYYYNLRLYGNDLNIFKEKIGFISNNKNEKLNLCCNNVAVNKNDVIPFMHSKIRELRKNNKITHKKFYEATKMHSHNLENSNNRFGISRYVLSLINSSLDGFEEIREIVEGDFYCDYVKSIKVVFPEKEYYLYDFTVEDTHSFIAGFGGIISHNSQSALLEAMQEKQVTIGGKTFPLPRPFFVMANNNPIESSGVYPLPEAQLDRFLFKLIMPYPPVNELSSIMDKNITLKDFTSFDIKPVLSPEKIMEMQKFTKQIKNTDLIKNYIADIVNSTKDYQKYNIELGRYIEWAASPRAAIGLFIGAKADAVLHGQDYITPQNVKNVAHDVLRHRIILNYKGIAEGIKTDDIITEVIRKVPIH